MQICWIARGATFAFVAMLLLPCALPEEQTSAASQAPPQIKVTSNLVLVRVVVRDAQGKPIEGLTSGDFRVFDRGKEQTISQFEAQSGLKTEAGNLAPSVETPGQLTPTQAMPENFFSLYFDDLNTSVADMNQARAAADKYLGSHLLVKDRVAIFTSGAMVLDFTADPALIHEALYKLGPSPRALTRIHECPSLSDYQALQITKMRPPDSQQQAPGNGPGASLPSEELDPTNDAWKVAVDEARRCGGDVMPMTLRAMAQRVVDQSQMLAQANLDGLEFAVKSTSRMPGRRTVMLVSPGFLSENVQAQVDGVIEQALRSQVVISSLDPKGLAVSMRQADASQSYVGVGPAGAAVFGLDKQREMIARGVLEQVAHGTGGEYFHNNNDLGAGFGMLAGSPAYYILAFAPKDVAQDGKFHLLKVTLPGEHKGFGIEARRGYFAASSQAETSAPASTGSQQATTEVPAMDAATHEQIREALFAKTDTSQLTVRLDTKIDAGQGETRGLSLSTHVEGKDIPFRKNGGDSLNTVTFVFSVFDAKGNMLAPQQKHVDLVVPDGQMPSFLGAGVNEDAAFQLKPGTYRLREVVIDSVGHRMTSLSRSVKVQ